MPERYLGRSLGKYRIDALLGSGGFAWVYKAWDPELEIPVALKILKPQYAGDEKFESRFRREAATAARLRHPNIIKIFAVGKDDDAVYFAMDYLPTGLADRLEVMTTLPESMLIRVGIDVASALGFAHRENVIHRDIKVDNILFDEHGNAIVADFGIARAVSNYAELTGTNMVVGTPQYFSPEQARGLALDGRADIYSLGITLYRAAAGVLPFVGEDWYEIARQHVEDRPVSPRKHNPGLSKELERIILICLEKEPEERFQSGEQLCQALAQLLQERGEGVTAVRTLAVPAMETSPSPMRAISRVRRGTKRLATPLTAAIVGGIALVAGTAFVMRSRGTAEAGAATGPTVNAPLGSPVSSATPATPTEPRVLNLEAPASAALTVNGVAVGKGTWRTDTLPAGLYTVVARLPASPGCGTTTDSQTVTLGSVGTQNVRLAPRPCGGLVLDVRPSAGARWQLESAGRRSLRGDYRAGIAIVVPAGEWTLTVDGPRRCAPYRLESLRIEAGRTRTLPPIPLLCEEG